MLIYFIWLNRYILLCSRCEFVCFVFVGQGSERELRAARSVATSRELRDAACFGHRPAAGDEPPAAPLGRAVSELADGVCVVIPFIIVALLFLPPS